jgi:hypothetical protein
VRAAEEEAACVSISAAASVGGIVACHGGINYHGRVPGTKNIHRGPCLYFSDYLSMSSQDPPVKFRTTFRIPLKLSWIISRRACVMRIGPYT